MEIKLYKISDDRRTLIKDVSSAGNIIATVNGTIKTDCDILAPTIELTYFSDLAKCNYMYVSDWGRYYYINDLKVGAQRCFITGAVDVLMSYAAQIQALKCIVERQEYEHQLYLQDKYFKALSYKIVKTFEWKKQFDKNNSSFVLTTGGES